MMKRFLFLLLVCLLVGANTLVHAQLSTKENPISFSFSIDSLKSIDYRIMPALDMKKIEAEDLVDEQYDMPPRFGYSHIVDFNLHNSGTWSTLSNGDKLWQLRISCPNALSINLLYDKFWIPEGGKFFIYSSDKKYSIGAFTSRNNSGDRIAPHGFATGLIFSDSILLEYYQPKDVDTDAVISISRVVHGYRYIGALSELRILNESCDDEVNVNCQEGQNWQNEKKSVALVVVDGERWCTGSLIATTSYEEKPYFLTADHCLGNIYNYKYDAVNAPNLVYWTFMWNYESPGCSNINYEPSHYTTTGATVVANIGESVSDFALLKLNEDPRLIQGYTPYYMGWDRTGNSGTSGVCIHHPKGDVKKISTYSTSPISSELYALTTNPNGHYWRVLWTQTTNGFGIVEKGSSGSALLNDNHKLIGQLSGGLSYCDNQTAPDWYGKFNFSWTGNGNNDYRRRLDYWLDSLGTNQMTIDGGFPIKISGPTIPGSPSVYYLENLHSNMTATWSLSSNNYILTSNQPSTNQCTINNSNHLHFSDTLTASIFNSNGVLLTTRTKTINTADGFSATYSQTMLPDMTYISGTLYDNGIINCGQGTTLSITSSDFYGASFTFSTTSLTPIPLEGREINGINSANPTYSLSGNTLQVTYTMNASLQMSTVTCINGDKVIKFRIHAHSPFDFPVPGSKSNIDMIVAPNGISTVSVSLALKSRDAQNDGVEELQLPDEWDLNVFNAQTGRMVYSSHITGGPTTTIDTTGWQPGIYILCVKAGKSVLVQKLKL